MREEAAKYLLDIRELLEGDACRELAAEAFSKVDRTRREKAGRIGQERSRAASLGAGLLLQLALRRQEPAGGIERYTVSELLSLLGEPMELLYYLGENGKPYLREQPFYFNLSHSGDYVFCGLSKREIGVDIQEHRAGALDRIGKRYFSSGEVLALERAEDREAFFFRLWARKEAYGKLTGGGIGDSLGKDLWSGGEQGLCWEEPDMLPGYSIAVCQYVTVRPSAELLRQHRQ